MTSRTRTPRLVLAIAAIAIGCGAPQTQASSPTAPTSPSPLRSTDTDGDGIPDARDECPNAPEDCDGFLDSDGCPDPDNDADGILDVCDHCPNDAETWNGFQDDDGCPDTPPVIIRSDIRIVPRVRFRLGSAQIDPAANSTLDEIARVMIANPQIERVLLRGNSSMGERNAGPLSERRARAVRDALVARFADNSNPTAGFGEVPNATTAPPLTRTRSRVRGEGAAAWVAGAGDDSVATIGAGDETGGVELDATGGGAADGGAALAAGSRRSGSLLRSHHVTTMLDDRALQPA